jgi:hypothetical protein
LAFEPKLHNAQFSYPTGTLQTAAQILMSQADIIRTANLTAGILSRRADGRGSVFYASDTAFNPIHGSTFANRYSAQRAVDRIARTQNISGSYGAQWADTKENRAIRDAMV